MQGESIRILLVEDSLPDALLVTRRLEMELGSLRQIEFERTSSLEEAIHHLRNKPADVVLLDLNLPDSAGTETVRRLRASEPKVPILVYASAGEVGLPLSALQAGAQDFLGKGDFGVSRFEFGVTDDCNHWAARLLFHMRSSFPATSSAMTFARFGTQERLNRHRCSVRSGCHGLTVKAAANPASIVAAIAKWSCVPFG